MIGDKLDYFPAYKSITDYVISLIRSEKIPNKKFCIAVSGESGCGKTSLANSLKIDIETLSDYTGFIIHMDDYFLLPPLDNHNNRLKSLENVGAHEVNLQLLDTQLKNFMEGALSIQKPLVNYGENNITSETISTEQYNFCIVEGTYVGLLENPDYKIFMKMDFQESKEQRMNRGRDKMDDFVEDVLLIEHHIIREHSRYADIIIATDLTILTND
ncbi:uridine kinase [Flavobacteriaceae bacterium MAR_2010_188]|nr:uridine kinase [Flavobacteriaceae bacterium MAR_2010_188]